MSKEYGSISKIMKYAAPALGLLAVVGAMDKSHAYPNPDFNIGDSSVRAPETQAKSKFCEFEEFQGIPNVGINSINTFTAKKGENRVYQQIIFHNDFDGNNLSTEINTRYFLPTQYGNDLFVIHDIEGQVGTKTKAIRLKIPSSQVNAFFVNDPRAICEEKVELPPILFEMPDPNDIYFREIFPGKSSDETIKILTEELKIE